MSKQNGLAPILIVLLIALTVVGYLLYQNQTKPAVSRSVAQPSPSPVATPVASDSAEITNWKTYTNTDGRYSIKYSNDYSLKEIDSIKSPEKFPAGKKQVVINPSDEKLNFSIYISYYPIPDLSQANEVMQQVAGCDRANEQEISHAPKGKDFLIDNQKAILYEDSLCAQFTAANFYILQNDNVYSISVVSTEKYSLHKATAEEILSTFRFD